LCLDHCEKTGKIKFKNFSQKAYTQLINIRINLRMKLKIKINAHLLSPAMTE